MHSITVSDMLDLFSAIGVDEGVLILALQHGANTKGELKPDTRQWLRRSRNAWLECLPGNWSDSKFQRVLERCKGKGLIVTTRKYNKRGLDAVLWYALGDRASLLLRDKVILTESPNKTQDKMVSSELLFITQGG
jgi:hypothetical protein